jgi:O-succinylbenzoic acid--CoA ligase
VTDLVAVEITGPRFVGALRRAWEAGDAVLPVDARLPRPAALALLSALRPAWVLGKDGTGHRRAGGAPVRPGDAVVVATSGTTGDPRGVVLTHDAVAASARATSARLGVDPATDHWIACLPVAHVGGLAVVMRALITATALTVLDGFDPDAVTDAAHRARAGGQRPLVSLVSAALARVEPALFGLVVLGGAAPPPELAANVVTTYGMTETGSGVVYDGLPLDGVDVRIDDAGQVWLRGPMLGRAYRGPDGETDLVDANGWLATGDAGAWDEDGRLVVDGRQADVVVTGGEKVWPGPVETVLARHPAVAEVAVTGAPDARWGQRVVAVVVPVAGRAPPTLDELRDLAKAELPAYAAPRQLVLAQGLDHTALGKVRRRDLDELVRRAQSS